MSFVTAYLRWASDLMTEHARLVDLVEFILPGTAEMVTPDFDVALVITSVYDYAGRGASKGEKEFF